MRAFSAPLVVPLTVTAALTVALAGCASPPPEHFYSLSSGLPFAQRTVSGTGTAIATDNAANNAHDNAVTAAPYYIEVLAPSVPPQVARSQLVVTTGAGRIDLLEQERWAAPLAAELGQALSLALTARLGAIDVFRTPTPEHAAIYRISTSVQRFESAPGQYALLDVVWSVRLAGSPKVLTCRSELKEQVAPGYDALVDGHRRAVGRLADSVGAAVQRLAGGGAGC
ncbi:membrane integrity-associated transporter subunit PqiC [Duganella sp. LX47W]|uniref:Membrane integrity-associated transporter subunit PqiC n=2 Tax=Rugamonas apoptosis TaxID=2758570 RepID=A0A7W2ILD3_9BURK|nr:membrane integrity-associated transporter subunit PqiC [Rugamonas apoptosis]